MFKEAEMFEFLWEKHEAGNSNVTVGIIEEQGRIMVRTLAQVYVPKQIGAIVFIPSMEGREEAVKIALKEMAKILTIWGNLVWNPSEEKFIEGKEET